MIETGIPPANLWPSDHSRTPPWEGAASHTHPAAALEENYAALHRTELPAEVLRTAEWPVDGQTGAVVVLQAAAAVLHREGRQGSLDQG